MMGQRALCLSIVVALLLFGLSYAANTAADAKDQKKGVIDGCCCSVETVDDQLDNIYKTLKTLKATTFFKYFKVNPYRGCKVWVEDYLCSLTEGGGCGLCVCDEQEVPEPWRQSASDLYKNDPIDTAITDDITKWQDSRELMWTNEEENDPESIYLNLELNQEKNSGYGGYHATRIWTAIYKENCFLREQGDEEQEEQCFEEKVLYRLLSGLHASTTVHICAHYSQDATGEWQPNLEFFKWKLYKNPEYIRNIYFAFVFLLRAASHAAPFLKEYDYVTGNPEEDAFTRDTVKQLFEAPLLDTCSPTFDESQMFRVKEETRQEECESEMARDQKMISLREQMRKKFYNVSEILDCVGCDMCRVNSKMQILGLGTGLKILLAENEAQRQHVIRRLQRNELIALINTLYRFSDALVVSQRLSKIIEEQEGITTTKTETTRETQEEAKKETKEEGEVRKKKNYVVIIISVCVASGATAYFVTKKKTIKRDPHCPVHRAKKTKTTTKTKTPTKTKKAQKVD